jgi:hypothetical protein
VNFGVVAADQPPPSLDGFRRVVVFNPQTTGNGVVQCIGETSIDDTASYVEFLTCLQMERDVRIEREANTPQ